MMEIDWGSFVSYFGEKSVKTLPIRPSGNLELSVLETRRPINKIHIPEDGQWFMGTYQHVSIQRITEIEGRWAAGWIY